MVQKESWECWGAEAMGAAVVTIKQKVVCLVVIKELMELKGSSPMRLSSCAGTTLLCWFGRVDWQTSGALQGEL